MRRLALILICLVVLAGCRLGSSEPEVLWTSQQGAIAAPLIHDGIAYLTGAAGGLYALDLSSGQERWSLPSSEPYAYPVVLDDVLYVGSKDKHLYALDVASGAQLWAFQGSASLIALPTIVDETIYIAGQDGVLYALDRQTGKEQWKLALGGKIYGEAHIRPFDARIAVEGDLLYLVTVEDVPDAGSKGRLHVYDRHTRQQVWLFEQEQELSAPLIDAGTVYVGAVGALVALDAQTGQERWRLSADSVFSSPIEDNGVLYVGAGGLGRGNDWVGGPAGLYAVDKASGAMRWLYETNGPVSGEPVLHGEKLYFHSLTDVHVVDAASGKEERIYKYVDPQGPWPAVDDERLLFGDDTGALYQIDQ